MAKAGGSVRLTGPAIQILPYDGFLCDLSATRHGRRTADSEPPPLIAGVLSLPKEECKYMTRKRRIELVITIVLLILFCALLVWAVIVKREITWPDALVRFAFAIVVALGVRWLGILFESLPSAEDCYRSNAEMLRARIDKARSRIWILQTWLPQIDGDAARILKAGAPDKRVILGSYRFEGGGSEVIIDDVRSDKNEGNRPTDSYEQLVQFLHALLFGEQS